MTMREVLITIPDSTETSTSIILEFPQKENMNEDDFIYTVVNYIFENIQIEVL